jgi:hypothetical protein
MSEARRDTQEGALEEDPLEEVPLEPQRASIARSLPRYAVSWMAEFDDSAGLGSK